MVDYGIVVIVFGGERLDVDLWFFWYHCVSCGGIGGEQRLYLMSKKVVADDFLSIGR